MTKQDIIELNKELSPKIDELLGLIKQLEVLQGVGKEGQDDIEDEIDTHINTIGDILYYMEPQTRFDILTVLDLEEYEHEEKVHYVNELLDWIKNMDYN